MKELLMTVLLVAGTGAVGYALGWAGKRPARPAAPTADADKPDTAPLPVAAPGEDATADAEAPETGAPGTSDTDDGTGADPEDNA